MNLIDAFMGVKTRNISLSDLDAKMDAQMSGPLSAVGLAINPDTAMRSAAVYSCVNVLAQDIASLPLITYRRLERGKERAPEHRLYAILHDAPNPEMTAYELRACLVSHMLLWGNAYAEIERSDAGINALWPLRPDRMTPTRDDGGNLVYDYRLPNGQPKRFQFVQIMHWRDLSSNGIIGLSPIAQNAESVGLDLATRQYGARFFGNDSRPGGILSTPGKLSDDSAKKMKDRWESAHRGLTNSQRIAVLEEGLSFTAIGVPPEEAQFLETRKYGRSEIAGIFRVPPHKIGDLERATFSNITESDTDYVKSAIRPRCVQIEQAIQRDLFAISDGKRSLFAEHLVDGLMRGDPVSRWTAYTQGLDRGVYCINDVLEMENMNAIKGGDVHLVPMNMQTLDEAVKPPEPPKPVPAALAPFVKSAPDAGQQDAAPANGNGQQAPANGKGGA